MDLFTKFYNVKRRGYGMELQEDSLGACKERSHETMSVPLMEHIVQGAINLKDQQLTFIEP